LRFIADGMLGKLSRWLRMLGCDVEYYNNLGDNELITKASESGRVLLTRDMQLFRRASMNGAQAFLIKGKTEMEKLAEVAQRFDIKLELDPDSSRCPKCNAKLEQVAKKRVLDKIPQSTSQYHDVFWICNSCGQVYWQGSHWEKITQKLLDARRLAESKAGSGQI
jgi:uncharacterized protein with PIN domain